MKLQLEKRETTKKSELTRLRAHGKCPGVLYSKEGAARPVTLNLAEMQKILRTIIPGSLPVTEINADLDGEKFTVLVRDIDYQRVTYDIMHVDLMPVEEKDMIEVKVPVRVSGQDECPGLKVGCQLKLIQRHVKVRCEKSKMPKYFTADISTLNKSQSVRIKDIKVPEGVSPLVADEVVIVTVGK
ncbi:MAG: 50S ribosomal protein L25 [Chlamydiia bacterium]|nr:50S ribosomal protein L25 [Chlamydiia bacterium]